MKDKSEDTKRAKVRIETTVHVLYRQSGQKEKHKCDIKDLSEDGLQIITDDALDKKKSLLLDIELPYPKGTVQAIGMIRWHKELKDPSTGATRHTYGIRFDTIDPTAQDNIFYYIYDRLESEKKLQEKDE